MGDTCNWHLDDFSFNDTDLWETTCGEAFCFIDGGPPENKVRFCCYCGKPVVATRRSEQAEEEAE